jgi:hypothetical protein
VTSEIPARHFSGFENTTLQLTAALAIGGTARYAPSLAVYMSALAGQFGVTLVFATQMERFKNPHIQMEARPPKKDQVGL